MTKLGDVVDDTVHVERFVEALVRGCSTARNGGVIATKAVETRQRQCLRHEDRGALQNKLAWPWTQLMFLPSQYFVGAWFVSTQMGGKQLAKMRQVIVDAAWETLSPDNASLKAGVVVSKFDPTQHPEVLAGRLTQSSVLQVWRRAQEVESERLPFVLAFPALPAVLLSQTRPPCCRSGRRPSRWLLSSR